MAKKNENNVGLLEELTYGLMDNKSKVSEVLNHFTKNKFKYTDYDFKGTKTGKCVLNINSDSINFGKMTIQFRNTLVNLIKKLWDEYYVNVSVSSKSTYGVDDIGDRKMDKDIASTSIVATLTPKNAIVNDYRFNGKSEAPNIK